MSPLSNHETVRSADEVPDPDTNYPYRTIGKLETKWPNGTTTFCTAASIGNQAIWTAGHCVYQKNRGGGAAEVKFAPAYKDGQAPFGWWFALPNGLWTVQTWIDWEVPFGVKRDIGGAILNLNENGQKISDVVGWLGFSWNQPREQFYYSFGYPGEPSPPFSAEAPRMFVCDGQSTGQAWDVWFGVGPLMQTMECDMGDGASGGPWITDLSNQAGQTNFLNGNFSSHHSIRILIPPHQGDALSPYFDDEAYNLWVCLVEGC